MLDDNDDSSWFNGGDDEYFPDVDRSGAIPLPVLRDAALKLFGRFMAQQTGLNPETYNFDDDVEAQRQFLSVEETDAIVQSRASMDNGEMMAVGGNTRAEAMLKIKELMRSLMSRVMSNVLAECVKNDLVDVAFNDAANDFAFGVNNNGHKIVQENKAFFESEHNDRE